MAVVENIIDATKRTAIKKVVFVLCFDDSARKMITLGPDSTYCPNEYNVQLYLEKIFFGHKIFGRSRRNRLCKMCMTDIVDQSISSIARTSGRIEIQIHVDIHGRSAYVHSKNNGTTALSILNFTL